MVNQFDFDVFETIDNLDFDVLKAVNHLHLAARVFETIYHLDVHIFETIDNLNFDVFETVHNLYFAIQRIGLAVLGDGTVFLVNLDIVGGVDIHANKRCGAQKEEKTFHTIYNY